jgi:hypothetical protein
VRAGPGWPGGWHEPPANRMVPAPNLHLVRATHGATPFGVTGARPPIHMAQEPLDQHHRDPPKQPPPEQQERQADNRVREGHRHGDAELAPRPLGAVVSREAAGTSGSGGGNGVAGDWLRLGLAPASASPGATAGSQQRDLFADRSRPPLSLQPPPGTGVQPAVPGIPQASVTLLAPRAGPPWMPPWSPAVTAFPGSPPMTLPFAHRTFYTPGAGASCSVDTIRVVLPPPAVAAASGVWFALQAAPHQ